MKMSRTRKSENGSPIALAAFITAAHRTASTRYTHRSNPAKHSYAFVNDSSLEDFWRAVCDEVNVSAAGNDTQRLEWLIRHFPGDAARALVGEMSDTGSLDEWRQKIDARMRADAVHPHTGKSS